MTLWFSALSPTDREPEDLNDKKIQEKKTDKNRKMKQMYKQIKELITKGKRPSK